jgi:cytochrome c oxidase cbb3-type subunit I/II
VAAAITLPMGLSTSTEYAELEWPVDIAIAVVWVTFAVNFFGTLVKRRERHLYVALWFYMASILAVGVLHIVNSLAVPVSAFKSYSVFAGVQDALVQWWYGHNAVAFILTTPFLGLMYYFMPKAAERPVYSYRLSIIHFWSLVFIYMWAGPHHLLYTALPEWAQTLGTAFSIALIAPSWGGMINGLLTLRGAWDKLRTDPILKFMVAAITFYGMATFEGPLMSLKSVNALSHYTNWTIGHVHGGALGWNGFLTFGMLYWMIPRLYNRTLYSVKLASAHFWLGLVGIGLYVLSMWTSGIAEGLMWKEFNAQGELVYGQWTDMLPSLFPMYVVRAVGGALYLVSVFIFVYNLWKTVRGAKVVDTAAQALPLRPLKANLGWHTRLEGKPLLFAGLTTVAVVAGGAFEIIPALMIENNVPTIAAVKPYTPLELEGRDIYVEEGCSNCHSQMVRPFRAEVLRYQGLYSKPGEFIYDRPFQFGSRRTGPDLHRIGIKYPGLGGAVWHYNHMLNARDTSKGSIMPNYGWLYEERLDLSATVTKIRVFREIFEAPYTGEEVTQAVAIAQAQANQIADGLVAAGLPDVRDRKIVALIAYLLRLGTDIQKAPPALSTPITNNP